MAILVRWQVPAATSSECDYDNAYIYRANSETGSEYSNIASQAITDNTYCDEDGSSINWYKIRFFNSGTSKWTEYSEAMQGGTFVGYCSMADFRAITNLTISSITDADAYDLITMAAYQINGDINTKVIRERMDYIDVTRDNVVDGSNTTFYVKNWKGKYFADFNNDSEVDTNDVTIYSVDSDGTETNLSLSSITVGEGKLVLSSAPESGQTLYVTYSWSFVNEATPTSQLKMASAFLTAALAQARLNIGRMPQISLGNLRLYRHMNAYDEFYSKYLGIIMQINDRLAEVVDVSGIRG